ncbi:MAG: EVE domain-containing protein [Elusimicrobia bacterium]|nr:EVE domain-containing protein [Elusimicrobiota bacterium]
MNSPRGLWWFSTEPDVYPWDVVFKEKRVRWDGIRGAAARKWMREIRKGDLVLGYHSSPEKSFVCLARAEGEAYPDPKDSEWLAIDLSPLIWLARRVPLEELRRHESLRDMKFLRMPRLSVSPVTEAQSKILSMLSKTLF